MSTQTSWSTRWTGCCWTSAMAKYLVNEAGIAHARELIEARRYVLRSEWGRVQPTAEEENAYLAKHSWAEYGAWHLAPSRTATSAACTAWGSSPATTGRPSGATRRSSLPRTTCCSCWTPPAPERTVERLPLTSPIRAAPEELAELCGRHVSSSLDDLADHGMHDQSRHRAGQLRE